MKKCPPTHELKCVKKRKKRKSKPKQSKQEILKIILKLPENEQERLAKFNEILEKDKQRSREIKQETKEILKPFVKKLPEEKEEKKEDKEDVKKLKQEIKETQTKLIAAKSAERMMSEMNKIQRKLRFEKDKEKAKEMRDQLEFMKQVLMENPQKGEGGMYDSEIEEVMKPDHNFVGVISADEINTLPIKPKMSFIINTDPRDKPGEHWQACRIDSTFDKSVEFYCPFGDDPQPSFMKGIKKLVDKMKLPYMLKFKINKVKNQDVRSDTCGFHCINFLKKRGAGQSFKQATGYKEQDNSQQMEKEVEQLKKQLGFGYV